MKYSMSVHRRERPRAANDELAAIGVVPTIGGLSPSDCTVPKRDRFAVRTLQFVERARAAAKSELTLGTFDAAQLDNWNDTVSATLVVGERGYARGDLGVESVTLQSLDDYRQRTIGLGIELDGDLGIGDNV